MSQPTTNPFLSNFDSENVVESVETVSFEEKPNSTFRFSGLNAMNPSESPIPNYFDSVPQAHDFDTGSSFQTTNTDVPTFQPSINQSSISTTFSPSSSSQSGFNAPSNNNTTSPSPIVDEFGFAINSTGSPDLGQITTTMHQDFQKLQMNLPADQTTSQNNAQTTSIANNNPIQTQVVANSSEQQSNPARAKRGPSGTIHGGVPPGVDGLLRAVKNRNIDAVRDLLSQGINPNSQNEEDQTPLHLAVLNPCKEIVKLLLDSPICDPNILDIAFNTPLHIASYRCEPKVRCGPDLSELIPEANKDSAALTPRPHPANVEDTELESIIRMLSSDPRTDVNIRNASLHVPLIYACLNGSYKLAAMLVRAGASVNAATHTDTYPLHAACENGFADIVRLLLINGALVNVRDYQGFTPLHLAARSNYGAICGLLWRHRADLNALTLPTANDPVGKKAADFATDMEIKNFLSGMKTSSSHPLEINFVTHELLGKCRIGMTMCPGRNKKDHRRNLQMDIAALLQAGTQVLVTLVQQTELDMMLIPDMMARVRAAGIEVIHAPIKDKWIPSRMGVLVELVDLILERVKQGKCITVHCNGGKGRTGLVVVATLVALGMEPSPATDIVRAARPGMLYNPAQILYVKAYKRTYRNREAERQTARANGSPVVSTLRPTSSTTGTELSVMGTMAYEFTTVLSPEEPNSPNLRQIQQAANTQEAAEQPALPSGQQPSVEPNTQEGILIDVPEESFI